MSYIEQSASDISNFSKAVISVWFRVPHTSIESAANSNGIIPIVTFGQIFDAFRTVNNVATSSYSYTENIYSTAFTCDLILEQTSTKTVTLPLTSRDADYNLDQCYIGLDCSQQFDDFGNPLPSTANLRVSLQTQDQAVKSGLQWEQVSGSSGTVNAYQGFPALACGELIQIDGHWVIAGDVTNTTTTYGDVTSLVFNQRESFAGTSQTIVVSPDRWHHVLLSFDISGSVVATGTFDGAGQALSSTCRMWLAFDDVNYTNDDLPRVPNFGAFLGTNDIITDVAVSTCLTSYNSPTEQTGAAAASLLNSWYQFDATFAGQDAPPTYNLSGASISIAGQPMGLPSVVETVSNIHHIELAEFQMFTGVTIDTSVVNNRRAFIGANGKPIDPTKALPGAAPGSPPPGVTATGKKPDVLFHGSRNWIAGKNTGTAGQFTPAGKIKKYKPDPGLPPAPQGTPQ
jgi:hypothetical protein